jgi:hypothetical protein
MSSGTELVGGRIPGEIIGTPTIVTSDSSGFTSEVVVMTLADRPLVAGRTYQVWCLARWGSSVATDQIVCRIRPDDVSGAMMQLGQQIGGGTSSFGYGPLPLMAFWTAITTGNQTFVVTGDRNGGTGTCRLDASPANPALLWCQYAFG